MDETDVFNKFKDSKGNFKESLILDIRGMLSLYEATKLRIHGEDVLDQALDFTTTHLVASMASNSSPFFATQIKNALKQSIYRNIPRNEVRHFICLYEQIPSHNGDLLTFAKLDFNLLQKMHQKELSGIQRWYKSLDVPKNLSFVRVRVVEIYLWAVGVYFEPEYAIARSIMAKVTAAISIVDDVYDSYGTFEELGHFTQALERWDISAANQLPDYMKHCYQILLGVYEEIEKLMQIGGKSYRVPYAIKDMKKLIQSYSKETEWLNKNYVPTVEEYTENGIVTSAYFVISTISFMGMGDVASKEVFEWNSNEPKIVEAASIISRFMNDIMSHEFEQQRGHAASIVECYMKQYGIGRQEAVGEVQKQIENAWKDINEGCLNPTLVPKPILTRVLNLARVLDVVYKDTDGYTFSEIGLKDTITSLIVDPIPF